MTNSTHRQPIGYWVKEADNLLSRWFDKIHAGHPLSRLAWQLMNSIEHRNNLALEELITLLSPFAQGNTIRDEVFMLEKEGIISINSGRLQLTEKGSEIHQAYLQRQTELRDKVMQGITSQDYETTINTLQQIVNNLKQDENFGGRHHT